MCGVLNPSIFTPNGRSGGRGNSGADEEKCRERIMILYRERKVKKYQVMSGAHLLIP